MTERFELLERLGTGGMGAVWKARDRDSGHFVAIKMLHPHLAEDPAVVARCEREVGYAPPSPNIVQVLGFGTREGTPYIVMEYVAGPSLREVFAARGPMPWDEVRWIARDIAQALAAAHDAGVVHRDVKPSNILIAPDGSAKLADFGIALGLDMTRLTHATQMGTPSYAAPLGQNEPAGDMYSLGCVLYEALVGHPPFEANSMGEIIAKHLSLEPDFSRIPAAAAAILRPLLAKANDQRLTAEELIRQLLMPGPAAGEPVNPRATAALPVGGRTGKPTLTAITATAGAALIFGGIAFAMLQGGGDGPEVTATGATRTAEVQSVGGTPGGSGNPPAFSATQLAGPTTTTATAVATLAPATILAGTSTATGAILSTPAPTARAATTVDSNIHVVEAGEFCATIADDAEITMDKFFELNPNVNTDCSNLSIGQVVNIGANPRGTTRE